jgi:hypothetical protein
MSTRHLHRSVVRFERTAGAAFKDASYADPIDRPPGRPFLLASRFLWIVGLPASLICWVVVWLLWRNAA